MRFYMQSFRQLVRLFACVLNAENVKLLLVKTDTSEHKSVSSEGFYGVDTHTAHHFLDFVVPGVNKVYKSLIADFGIKTFYKVGALCSDTPVALAAVTAAAEVTAH